LAAFAIVGPFLVVERALRQGLAARSFETTLEDRGPTRLIGAAFGYALTAGAVAPLLSRWRRGQIQPRWIRTLSLGTMLGGLGTRPRCWSRQLYRILRRGNGVGAVAALTRAGGRNPTETNIQEWSDSSGTKRCTASGCSLSYWSRRPAQFSCEAARAGHPAPCSTRQ